MHPIIAFLSFLFSPSDDWLLKKGYETLMNNDHVVQSADTVQRLTKTYPTGTKKAPEPVDPILLSLWGEILKKTGHPQEATAWLKKTLKHPGLSKNLKDDIHIHMGEMALQMKDLALAKQHFDVVIDNNGSRSTDARIGLLIHALASEDLTLAEERAGDLLLDLNDKGMIKRARLPLGLLAYAQGRYDKTIEHLAHLNEDPRAIYFNGLAQRKILKPHDAIAKWQKLRKNNPNSPWAQLATFQLAETYFSLEDYGLSERVSSDALANNPNGPLKNKFLFRLASLDMKRDDYDSALKRFAQIPRTDTVGERAHTLTAEAFVHTGRSKDLLAHMKQQKSRNPNVVNVYQTAWSTLFDKKWEKTLEVSNLGLTDFYHKDFTPRLLLLQGLAFDHMGKNAEALATYQTIADRFPESYDAAKATHWAMLNYMRLGRHKEAVTHVAYLWDKIPQQVRHRQPETAFWLGEAHLNLKRYPDADDSFTEFLTIAPPDNDLVPQAQFQRSISLTKLGKTSTALVMLDEFERNARQLDNKEWVGLAYQQRGNIFFNQKDYEKAVVQYRNAVPNSKTRYYEGMALYRLDYFNDAIGSWAKLIEDADNAKEKNEFTEKATFKMARTHFELGQATEAVTQYTRYIESYPNSPRVKQALLQSGHAMYNTGNLDQATLFYEHYLRHYNTTEDLVSVTPFLAASYVRKGKTLRESERYLRGLPPTETMADFTWKRAAENYNVKYYEQANKRFADLLAAYPTHKNTDKALFYRAETYFNQENWLIAEGSYDTYLKWASAGNLEHAALAQFRKSVSIYNQDRLLEAAKNFEKLIQDHPGDELIPHAKENMVLCYYYMGDWPTMNAKRELYGIEMPQTDQPLKEEKRDVYEVLNNKNIVNKGQPASDSELAATATETDTQ